jgi:hypothetical protein
VITGIVIGSLFGIGIIVILTFLAIKYRLRLKKLENDLRDEESLS